MKLSCCLLRAYRSYNFDFQEKMRTSEAQFLQRRALWEAEDSLESWKPWTRVPITGPITAVVGVNEAGKTHLIDALEKVTTAKALSAADVCRYSPECRPGKTGSAQVGAVWSEISEHLVRWLGEFIEGTLNAPSAEEASTDTEDSKDEEAATVDQIADGTLNADAARLGVERGDAIVLLAKGRESFRMLICSPDGELRTERDLTADQHSKLRAQLPRPIHVYPRTWLPPRVLLKTLFRVALDGAGEGRVRKFIDESKKKPYVFKDMSEFNNHLVSKGDRLAYRLLQEDAGLDYEALGLT